MQSLPVQIVTTFIGDALALVNGFGRIVTHIVMAPVERIANACDVTGILEQRAARAVERVRLQQAWRELSASAPKPHHPRRHRGLFGCLRVLGELT
jgi:hypothetical protein